MIEVVHGDITVLDVDAIVNAANRSLLGGGGADGAIHRAAGPELLAACRTLGGCPTGEARVTPGFRLRARWVVHAVGPVWRGGAHDEEALLRRTYESALRAAQSVGAGSVALPCISTGAHGFPKDAAATIALGAMHAFAADFARIVACCYGADDAERYRASLALPR